jgi:hypothetical protein
MTQGKWWSWYAYEDDDAHVMYVNDATITLGCYMRSQHNSYVETVPPSDYLRSLSIAVLHHLESLAQTLVLPRLVPNLNGSTLTSIQAFKRLPLKALLLTVVLRKLSWYHTALHKLTHTLQTWLVLSICPLVRGRYVVLIQLFALPLPISEYWRLYSGSVAPPLHIAS